MLIPLMAVWTTFFLLSAATAAEIQNVVIEQSGQERIIHYDLAGEEIESDIELTVVLQGRSYTRKDLHLSGDIGPVKRGRNKSIIWKVMQDFPGGTTGPVETRLSVNWALFKDRKTDMEFIAIPGGCFKMGDVFGDGQANEKPAHEVCVGDFAIGKGSIFVLGKGIELDEKEYILEGWRMVESNVEKIKNLSLDLLHYGRYAKDQLSPCDPNRPADEVLRLMEAKAQEEGVRLGAELSPGLAPVVMDPDGIQRCLMNLLGNAIDACRDNAAAGRDKRVALRTVAVKAGGIEYRVVDNGCGMGDDVQQRLFQSFFSTKGTDGTGIGLMMTKRIVDQHLGTVEVESRPGEGTTMVISLPAGPSADRKP